MLMSLGVGGALKTVFGVHGPRIVMVEPEGELIALGSDLVESRYFDFCAVCRSAVEILINEIAGLRDC
jgi:hypothetical protein